MSEKHEQRLKDYPIADRCFAFEKSAFEDPNLSWSAKGIWAFLVSNTDPRKASVSHLSKTFVERGGGEKAVKTLLNELIENGYCMSGEFKSESGVFIKNKYVAIHKKG